MIRQFFYYATLDFCQKHSSLRSSSLAQFQVLFALSIILQDCVSKNLNSSNIPNCFWDDLMACVGRSWRMAPDYWNYFSACAGRLCKAGGWLLELFVGPKPAFPATPAAIMDPEGRVRISYETATNESSLVDCFQLEHWPQCTMHNEQIDHSAQCTMSTLTTVHNAQWRQWKWRQLQRRQQQ